MNDRKKLMNTATRSGRHAGIIETARDVIERGIDPRSDEMVDLIPAAYLPRTSMRPKQRRSRKVSHAHAARRSGM
jgi:hypothetical protein